MNWVLQDELEFCNQEREGRTCISGKRTSVDKGMEGYVCGELREEQRIKRIGEEMCLKGTRGGG